MGCKLTKINKNEPIFKTKNLIKSTIHPKHKHTNLNKK